MDVSGRVLQTVTRDRGPERFKVQQFRVHVCSPNSELEHTTRDSEATLPE
jgi:hypothetical protein